MCCVGTQIDACHRLRCVLCVCTLVDMTTQQLSTSPTQNAPAIGTRVTVETDGYAPVWGEVRTAPYLGIAHRRESAGLVLCVRVWTDSGSYFAHAVSDVIAV